MNKIIILIFSLLITNTIFSQEKAIKITNQVSKKEIVIKENKRIKIKTVDGQKLSGRFTIENNSIFIENKQIELSKIAEIKRNPLFFSILTSGGLIYAGAVILGVAVIVGVFGESSAFLFAIPAAGMIYTGIKSPSFNKKFKSDSNWIYEIRPISEWKTVKQSL